MLDGVKVGELIHSNANGRGKVVEVFNDKRALRVVFDNGHSDIYSFDGNKLSLCHYFDMELDLHFPSRHLLIWTPVQFRASRGGRIW